MVSLRILKANSYYWTPTFGKLITWSKIPWGRVQLTECQIIPKGRHVIGMFNGHTKSRGEMLFHLREMEFSSQTKVVQERSVFFFFIRCEQILLSGFTLSYIFVQSRWHSEWIHSPRYKGFPPKSFLMCIFQDLILFSYSF